MAPVTVSIPPTVAVGQAIRRQIQWTHRIPPLHIISEFY